MLHFFSVMLFERKYSDELNQVFMKEHVEKKEKKILLLATVLKALLSVVMPGGYKGLKQGPQLSAQHGSPLTESVG